MNNKIINVLKVNIYTIIIFLVLIAIALYIAYDTKDISYSDAYKISQNIQQQEGIDFNEEADNYLFYRPLNYVVSDKTDKTVTLTSEDSVFTLYFGNDTNIDSEYLESINKDLNLVYEESVDDTTGFKYFYVWEYANKPEYVQIMIGNKDSYISGVFLKNSKKRHVTDMSNIFDSIKKYEKGEV